MAGTENQISPSPAAAVTGDRTEAMTAADVFEMDQQEQAIPAVFSVSVLEPILLGSLVYLVVFALLRFVLNRVTGTLNIGDLLIIVLIHRRCLPERHGSWLHIRHRRPNPGGDNHLLELLS